MGEVAHTPKPWCFDNDWHRLPSVLAGKKMICTVEKTGHPERYSRTEEQEANARLIAAAPELLEALEMMIADFSDYPASERPCLAFDKARAAIAKAKAQSDV